MTYLSVNMIPNQITYNIQSNLFLCVWHDRYKVCCKILSARFSAKNNHYTTLKLKPNATSKEIKHAYYELSKIYHPDVNCSEEAVSIYHKINDAYRVLGNYHARKKYDLQISILSKSVDHKNSHKSMQHNFAKQKSTFPTVNTKKYFDFDIWWHHHYSAIQKDKMQRYEEYSRKTFDVQRVSLWPLHLVIILMNIIVIIMYYKS